MYSVMLMMAMTSGGDLPNLGHHGCCGGGYASSGCGGYASSGYSCCGGGYASSGCGGYASSGYSCCGGGYASSGYSCGGGGYVSSGASCCGGGYASSCCGGRHRLFGGRHHSSCCGGSSGGYSCGGGYSGGYSCCGGYSGYSPCGGGVMYGPASSPGEVIIEKKPGETTPEPVKPPKETTPPKETLVPTPATIIVSLPADAKLSIDDAATVSTSAVRVFTSPELPIGQDFHYTLKAEYVREGKPVVLSKDITVRAGEQTRVNMEEPAGVASR